MPGIEPASFVLDACDLRREPRVVAGIPGYAPCETLLRQLSCSVHHMEGVPSIHLHAAGSIEVASAGTCQTLPETDPHVLVRVLKSQCLCHRLKGHVV